MVSLLRKFKIHDVRRHSSFTIAVRDSRRETGEARCLRLSGDTHRNKLGFLVFELLEFNGMHTLRTEIASIPPPRKTYQIGRVTVVAMEGSRHQLILQDDLAVNPGRKRL